jgi:hypothetical protein
MRVSPISLIFEPPATTATNSIGERGEKSTSKEIVR